MAIGDIFELTLRGHAQGQLQVNVFDYKLTTATAIDLPVFSAYWQVQILPMIASIVTVPTSFEEIEIKQIVGGANFYVAPILPVVVGAVAGEELPVTNCWTFRYVRSLLGRRHGYKRFSAIAEGSQSAGGPTVGMYAILQNVAIALGSDLQPATGPNWHPVVLHTVQNGQPVVPPVAWDFAAVIFAHIGTQNTRKPGRGA